MLGNENEADRLYSQIPTYADKNWTAGNPAYVYLNIMALKREGKTVELKEKMLAWQEELAYKKDWSLSGQLDSDEVKWVLARYAG